MAMVGQQRDGRTAEEPTPAPPRPRSDEDLKFRREDQVRWFKPKVLAKTGLHVAISAAVGDFLDKRELQQVVPPQVIQHGDPEGEVWVDFVADTGDGFDATYSVAWLTAQRQLTVEGVQQPLPRPGLVILGGDEVYPSASSDEYENRFRGPYRASFPHTDGEPPKLLAIPGNHDWYDGLTNFMRLFCSLDQRWIGGRQTAQTHSYFAVKLPHSWWLWGIDIQFDSYIDDPQLRFFKGAVEAMVAEEERGGERARIILCTGKPSWADVEGDPKAFRNLAYFKQETIGDKADLLLSISGDSHHYARYDSVEPDTTISHRITAGGAGAFLHPTHHLDDPLNVPLDPHGDEKQAHRLRCRYPSPERSRLLSLGATGLPVRNLSFLWLPAIVYLLLGWSTHFGVQSADGSEPVDESLKDPSTVFLGLFRNPVSILVLLLVLFGLYGFAKPWADWSQGWKKVAAKVLMGSTHFAAQLAVGLFLVRPLATWVGSPFEGRVFTAVSLGALVALGAFLAAVTMGAYLALWCALFRAHGNEAFSAMSLTQHKNFLRLHIGPDGLTVYPIGLDRSTNDWEFDPDNPDVEAPWLKPAPGAEPRPRLIEKPLAIGSPAGRG